MEETKQQVTTKVIVGVIAIISSFIIGKLAFILIILFPTSEAWLQSMVVIYLLSWVIMICGIYLAGIESYKLVTHKYREYRTKTAQKMKEKSKKMALKTADALRKP